MFCLINSNIIPNILFSHDFSSSLPIELKKLPSKFNELTEEVKGLKKQVHELEIELPRDLKEIPTKLEDFTKTVIIETVQAKLNTLDALPSLLNKVTNALNQFAQAIASKITEDESKEKELVDLLGPEVVNKYYNDKLQYDIYYDIMLNRRTESRITNCDVLTKKGPITLKVYREDGTSEVIPNFKASDLHLGEWREDPLNKLNDLANKKRKHADDIHDYFKANKRLNSSVQYGDHPAGTILNEPVLEIFFRRHQGPRMDDHARTFSSLMLAEIDKRNLNPLKQIRTIEQQRLFIYLNRRRLLGSVLEPFTPALQVLRRLGSIFTSVYAADQKLKKAYKVYNAGKRLLYVKRNKAISLGKDTSKVGIEVQQLFLKGLYLSLSSNEITPQLSFNHLAIPQARFPGYRA
ncbi:hypothetical protein Tco_0051600 [Tanacetum coccineum]